MRQKKSIGRFLAGLRKHGFIVKRHYMCCGNCAIAALENEGVKEGDKFVFIHKQKESRLRTAHSVYLDWGSSIEHGKQIVKLAHKYGLWTKWAVDTSKTIYLEEPASMREAA